MITPRAAVAPGAVADHYDDLDVFYREVWGEHVHHGLWRTGREDATAAVEQLVRHAAARAGVERGDRVVDVGCGYGATARLLADSYAAAVTGITLSPAQHAYASAVCPDASNPTYVLGDWLANGFPDAAFDRAVAIESTEHMGDKAGAFSELRRVLRPGGQAAICAWIARDAAREWEVRHLLEPICHEGRLPGMGTEDDYRRLLAAAGLEVVGVDDLSAAVRQTWARCAARVGGRLAVDRRYRRYLLDARSRNRVFVGTVLRIWAAYHTGSMRYLLFVARRPA